MHCVSTRWRSVRSPRSPEDLLRSKLRRVVLGANSVALIKRQALRGQALAVFSRHVLPTHPTLDCDYCDIHREQLPLLAEWEGEGDSALGAYLVEASTAPRAVLRNVVVWK